MNCSEVRSKVVDHTIIEGTVQLAWSVVEMTQKNLYYHFIVQRSWPHSLNTRIGANIFSLEITCLSVGNPKRCRVDPAE